MSIAMMMRLEAAEKAIAQMAPKLEAAEAEIKALKGQIASLKMQAGKALKAAA